MKEGKGNTFSTSLNKSFFYSFSRYRSYMSRDFSENRSIAIDYSKKKREKGGLTQANDRHCVCVCARSLMQC